MKYYSETEYWKNYQIFLPKDLRYSENTLPVEEFWPWGNFQIHLDRMENPDSPIKIIILHGAGGNGRIVGLFGNFLYQQGFEYVAPDLIGYGLTQNSTDENIEYDRWVHLVSDLVDHELQKDNRPILLFGLSMGGMLAYQVAAKNGNVNGLIATTLADPRSTSVRDELAKNKLLSRLGLPIANAFPWLVDAIKIPINWLCKMDRITNDKEFSKIFAQDRSAGGSMIKLRFLRTFMTYTPVTEPENFTSCPVLFMQPEKDTWTTLAISKPFYDRLNSPKKWVLLGNCGHAPYEEPGLSQMKTEILAFLNEIKIIKSECE